MEVRCASPWTIAFVTKHGLTALNFTTMIRIFDKFLKMKTLFFFVIIILGLTCSNLFAQSLIEKLGGLKTDFVFTTDSIELQIVDQAIIQRGFSDFNVRTNSSNSYGHAYGYGLQTFHLEFITTSDLKTFERFKKKPDKAIYDIKLYDENDTLLLNFGVLFSKSKASIKTSGMTSYSLNLIQVPLILFDRVKKIDITLILM